ncbi:MAG: recombinase family protein [Phycisphaeraceae bacterium]|nr:recombinase family protein [Phycisphaeraceae bacterium]
MTTRARSGFDPGASHPARPRGSPNPPGSPPTLRCAVYTRKSSEEGLDMAFNSLDAQREAGTDYIKSQRSHGWVLIPTLYDDGGFSGGTTERPGLQRLLTDIRGGRVDIVVVYKVDRLSRSLSDFARLMQTFDEHHVSFVSVTQQFNTTTSMGRLTLNMLLSFAQFEREVAGERIRDKIGATMRKGLFIVGQTPFGYRRPALGDPDPDNRVIRIVPEEAALVRRVYTMYLEHRSLLTIAQTLNAEGLTTRRWTSSRKRTHGGRPWTNALLHRILTNPVYIGKIVHTRGSHLPNAKDRAEPVIWPGLHEPIIDQEMWDRVRAVMDEHRERSHASWSHTHLLKGKIHTADGHRLTPGGTGRKRPDGRSHRVPYYVSMQAVRHGYAACTISSINATRIDDLVRALVLDRLEAAHGLVLDAFEPLVRDRWVREVVERVVVGPNEVEVVVGVEQIRACAEQHGLRPMPSAPASAASRPTTSVPTTSAPTGSALGTIARAKSGRTTAAPRSHRCLHEPVVEVEREIGHDGNAAPIRERLRLAVAISGTRGRRATRGAIVAPDGRDLTPRLGVCLRPEPAPHLVRAIGMAFALHEELMATGDEVNVVARRLGLHPGRAHHLLHLTRLSPDVIRAVLTGTIGRGIALTDLHAAADHIEWAAQHRHLRLPVTQG